MQQPIEPFLNFIRDDVWSQAQREALVDLLVWTMYVDRAIRAEENDELDEITFQLNGKSSIPVSQYLPQSIAKIRNCWHDDVESQVLLEELSMYLDSPEIRAQALNMCQQLAAADGDLANEEITFMQRLKTQFGL